MAHDPQAEARWVPAGVNHPRPKAEWFKLFKRTFRFTGGEIVGVFLLSTGYLPEAHAKRCPVYALVAAKRPAWMRSVDPSRGLP